MEPPTIVRNLGVVLVRYFNTRSLRAAVVVMVWVGTLSACASDGSEESGEYDAGESALDLQSTTADSAEGGEDLGITADVGSLDLGSVASDPGNGEDVSGPSEEDTQVVEPPGADISQSASTGGWASGACTTEIEGTGTKAGETAYDFTQMDQNGQPLRLHDYCDKLVLLIGSAFW